MEKININNPWLLLLYLILIILNSGGAALGATFNGNDLVLRLPLVYIQPEGTRFDNIEIRLGTDGYYHILSGVQAAPPTAPPAQNSPTFDLGNGILNIPSLTIEPTSYIYINVQLYLGGDGAYRVLAGEPDAQSNQGTMTNVLEQGDRYDYVLEPASTGSRYSEIWAAVSDDNIRCWVNESNPLYSYQFFMAPPLVVDPPPNTFVPNYRYTGFDVFTGSLTVLSTGTYVSTRTGLAYPAAGVTTWSDAPEFLIIVDASTIVHATRHFDGSPIVSYYHPGTQCP